VILSNELSLQLTPLGSSRIHDYLGTLLFELFSHLYLRVIDRKEEGWDGHVGFIPDFIKELKPDLNKTVLICGPPIMIKYTLAGLKELGFQDTQIYTTMELRMKCGIGKCGRCNIGSKYVCKEGPVFRFDELGELPDEY
jgi:NAD(P)H-flavin reductase